MQINAYFDHDSALEVESAVCFALEIKLSENLYNIVIGKDLAIKELAVLIQKIIGHKDEILLDSSKPDGTSRKLMNVEKMKNTGWKHQPI